MSSWKEQGEEKEEEVLTPSSQRKITVAKPERRAGDLNYNQREQIRGINLSLVESRNRGLFLFPDRSIWSVRAF